MQIPGLFSSLQNQTEYDWIYYLERDGQSSLAATHGGFWPRGKMLGGTSANNAMVYVRGNKRDFDTWEQLGNEGWSWDNVLPYFKKLENNQAEISNAPDATEYGTDGPLKINYYFQTEISNTKHIIFEPAVEKGYKMVADINGPNFMGYTSVHGNHHQGKRWSTAKAYLSPPTKPNLHIVKYAHVTKVNIDNNNVATSVTFLLQGKEYTVNAKKEIILSAGAVNTPQLLMLSGIGPRDQLEKFNIPVIKDLKVGQNLQDHVMSPYYMPLHKGQTVKPNIRDIVEDMYTYSLTGTGPLSTIPAIDAVGFINTVNETDIYPDLQMHQIFIQNNNPTPAQFFSKFGYDKVLTQQIADINKEEDIMIYLPILLNPKSIGHIEIRSADPFDKPKIFANYLHSQDDVDTLVRSIRIIQSFQTTNYIKNKKGREEKLHLPRCDKFKFNTEEYWGCYVRHISTTLYHPVGTAKMGPSSDPDAVVDAKLKVYGIKGLRVADASIMPKITSGNTNAPVIMIGEKAADLIKADWATNAGGKTEL